MSSAYLDQAKALWGGGVRIFHLERCQDPLNARAALVALTRLEDQTGSPAMKVVSVEAQESGTALLGTVEAFWREIESFRPQAFGVVGRLAAVEQALTSIGNVVEVPLVAMVDIFAPCSPEGWLQSPKSLSLGVADLVNWFNVRIVGLGMLTVPEFIIAIHVVESSPN